MAQFFDFDPFTGLRYDFDYNEETGEAKIRASQDVSPLLERQKALQNTGAADKGIKNGMWHYASIPPVIQIALRNKGIDIYSKDKDMLNRMLKEIDQNYPWLKTTTKTHRVSENRHL